MSVGVISLTRATKRIYALFCISNRACVSRFQQAITTALYMAVLHCFCASSSKKTRAICSALCASGTPAGISLPATSVIALLCVVSVNFCGLLRWSVAVTRACSHVCSKRAPKVSCCVATSSVYTRHSRPCLNARNHINIHYRLLIVCLIF